MQIGAKIYYESLTGDVIQVIPPRSGAVTPQSKEQDFHNYESLRGRVPGTVGVVQLSYPYGTYDHDFSVGDVVRVDAFTNQLYFKSKPTPGEPSPDPEPQLSISDRVEKSDKALASSLKAVASSTVGYMLLDVKVKQSDNALADLQLRYASTVADLKTLQTTVELLQNTLASALSEISILKGGASNDSGGQ